MTDGEVRYSRDGAIATVIFDRPAARNAMTWRMYEQLGEACARIRSDDGLRVAVFRGAGGKSFIAGTDIAQFQAFESGEDGIAYEAKMEDYIGDVETLPVPTLAVIEGFAIGAASPSRRRAICASQHPIRVSASRSRAPWAIASRSRITHGWWRDSELRAPSGCCCWRRIFQHRRRWQAASSARSWSPRSSTAVSPNCAHASRTMRR